MPTSEGTRARLIAYYLPQFHPIPENDRWWGKGFTEWTNVVNAKPQFRGHYQPRLPSELGFYDLRAAEVRAAQAELASRHGIEGFCYWHYWFAGKRLLERPFNEVLSSGAPDFPFCLAWANQSWTGVWHGAPDRLLIMQQYPGVSDSKAHFYALLPAFSDHRYITVEGKPVFVVQRPHDLPEARRFTDLWQELALKEGLKGIYFIGLSEPDWNPLPAGFNGSSIDNPGALLWLMRREWRGQLLYKAQRAAEMLWRGFPAHPRVYLYRDTLKFALPPLSSSFDQYPCAIPDFDNTPRSGERGFVLHEASPEGYGAHLSQAIAQVASCQPDKRIVFIKSWNEWAEGNYIEPDERFGRAYLQATRDAVMVRTEIDRPLVLAKPTVAAAQVASPTAKAAAPDSTAAIVGGPRPKRRVVFFASQKPYPGQSGDHKRAISVLSALREIGCETTLLSLYDREHSAWDGDAVAMICQRERLAKECRIYYQADSEDDTVRKLAWRWYGDGKRQMPIDSVYYGPPQMQRWLTRTVDDISPDAIILTYAYYDRLLDHRRFASTVRIMDSLAVLSQTSLMWHALNGRLPATPIDPKTVDRALLEEDFFDSILEKMDRREAQIYDRYNHTIAISPRDQDVITRNVRHTDVTWLPMTFVPDPLANSYAGPALYTSGPNPFNLQGMVYFSERVLPLILKAAPDFRLNVTGWCSGRVLPADGIVMNGFVPDLNAVFADAGFSICPILAGTGQMVKIVEAMAHGLAVVAMRHLAGGSPILRHGENGFIADDAGQMAQYVLRLWHDKKLRRTLGEATRASVAQQAAEKHMVNELQRMILPQQIAI